jgi:hypothetical protein
VSPPDITLDDLLRCAPNLELKTARQIAYNGFDEAVELVETDVLTEGQALAILIGNMLHELTFPQPVYMSIIRKMFPMISKYGQQVRAAIEAKSKKIPMALLQIMDNRWALMHDGDSPVGKVFDFRDIKELTELPQQPVMSLGIALPGLFHRVIGADEQLGYFREVTGAPKTDLGEIPDGL